MVALPELVLLATRAVASYSCNNGSLGSSVSNSCSSTTYSSCSASTVSNCVRSYRSHNGVSGSCRSGYSGSCSYRCNNGSWTQISNTCSYNPPPPPPSNCSASTISNCSLSATNHNSTSGSCDSGYTGSCSYRCNNGAWSSISNSCTVVNTGCSGTSFSKNFTNIYGTVLGQVTCTITSGLHAEIVSGTCSENGGYTDYAYGSCSAQCYNGTWISQGNGCLACSSYDAICY